MPVHVPLSRPPAGRSTARATRHLSTYSCIFVLCCGNPGASQGWKSFVGNSFRDSPIPLRVAAPLLVQPPGALTPNRAWRSNGGKAIGHRGGRVLRKLARDFQQLRAEPSRRGAPDPGRAGRRRRTHSTRGSRRSWVGHGQNHHLGRPRDLHALRRVGTGDVEGRSANQRLRCRRRWGARKCAAHRARRSGSPERGTSRHLCPNAPGRDLHPHRDIRWRRPHSPGQWRRHGGAAWTTRGSECLPPGSSPGRQMMTRHSKKQSRRSSGTRAIAVCLLLAVAAGLTTSMRASDNLDFAINGQVVEIVWDSRLFDGTPGFPGAIVWHHNPSGIRSNLDPASFEATIDASFNTWESVDDGVPQEPLVPVVNFGGQSAATDAFALDGVNLVAWLPDFPDGTLAVTPCWGLDLPTTTTTNAQGQTVLPVEGGESIPFPGPPGVTYPVGTVIDCGMRFDSLDPWSTTAEPDPGAFDVQGVATHEAGHFIAVSHSTLGDFTASNAMSATMLPVVAPGDANPRTLEADDKAAVLRIHARNRYSGAIPPTVGGRGVITLRLVKDNACVPATGVSVVAYRTQGGINGVNRVEMFSGSQLRAVTPHQPFNGSVTLNVPPLPAGESYTIYARTLETGSGVLAANRYNYTTINSNLLDAQNQSRTFDQLATTDSLEIGRA